MKIELDCVRDVMLCVEENTGLRQRCYFIDYSLNDAQSYIGDLAETPEYQTVLEKQYDNEELLYHLKYCIESGLLVADAPSGLYQMWVYDLTPKGHEFLANIRNKNIWSKVKGLVSKAGSNGVDVVIEIAKAVSVETAKGFLLKGK